MKIETSEDLYLKTVGENKFLSSFLSGHLVVEYLLRRLIYIYNPALSKIADGLTHAKLIDLNYDIGMISDSQKHVLVIINKMRNKFAHQITYELSIEDLKDLFGKAAIAFEDFTDGIRQGIEELTSCHNIEDLDDWVISELFVQISYDLHHTYHDHGGDLDVF